MSSPSGKPHPSKRIRGGGSNRPYGIRELDDGFVMSRTGNVPQWKSRSVSMPGNERNAHAAIRQ